MSERSDPGAATGTAGLPVLEGWFTLDRAAPQLLGNRCRRCGSYYFPRLKTGYCRNPDCDGDDFEDVPLSRHGRLWSFTNAAYAPPEPYVAQQPFTPFGIAAVELETERMIVLGQLASGTELASLKLGAEMELVLEPLDDGRLTWKWALARRPLAGADGGERASRR